MISHHEQSMSKGLRARGVHADKVQVKHIYTIEVKWTSSSLVHIYISLKRNGKQVQTY